MFCALSWTHDELLESGMLTLDNTAVPMVLKADSSDILLLNVDVRQEAELFLYLIRFWRISSYWNS